MGAIHHEHIDVLELELKEGAFQRGWACLSSFFLTKRCGWGCLGSIFLHRARMRRSWKVEPHDENALS